MFKLFDLSLKINGFDIRKAQKEFEQILEVPEKDYQNYIEKKRREIVEYHLQNNSFYQEIVGSSSFEKWEDLPILTKKNLQKPLVQRLSKDYTEKTVFVNKTSG